jgi:hypothetical protein
VPNHYAPSPRPVLLPRHPGGPSRAHQLCAEHRYACDSASSCSASHTSRTGQFVYVCPFTTPDNCLAAMDSLNVNSCFQVPRYTCFNTLINNVHIKISVAQDYFHRLVFYLDSGCTADLNVSETQGDFTCFDVAGVCVHVFFFFSMLLDTLAFL